MPYCNKCGAENIPSNRFCVSCGAMLNVYEAAPMNGQSMSSVPNAQVHGQAPPAYGQQMPPQQQYTGIQPYQSPQYVQQQQARPMQQPYQSQQPPYGQQQYQQPQAHFQQPAPQHYQQPPAVQPQVQPVPAPQPQQAPQMDPDSCTIHLSQHEKALLTAFTRFNNIDMEDFVKKATLEKLKMEFARRSADNAYNVFMSDLITYPLDEVIESHDL